MRRTPRFVAWLAVIVLYLPQTELVPAFGEESVNLSRYILEAAAPGAVGIVQPLDQTIVESLCRDKDGCEVLIQMVNWDAVSFPGQVTSRSARLFLSATSGWWRFADIDISGRDDSGTTDEYAPWDCFFTDAENAGGSPNARTDADPGFGLLNVAFGGYSDSTTTCRVVLID